MPQCPIAGDRDANARNSQTTDYDLPIYIVHCIFVLNFLLLSSSFFFFPRPISAVGDWMSTIHRLRKVLKSGGQTTAVSAVTVV